MQDYWHRQSDKPLYPDLLWSRPENRAQAGKLLIVGGNAHGFAAVAEAYSESGKAGIGLNRILLPDSLRRTVGRVLETGEYAPSTPSGSFARTTLAEMLAMAQWADGVLVAGDLGRNSETAVLLEQFASKYTAQLTLTKDAVDYFTKSPSSLLARPDTLLVLSFAQLQKIASSARFASAFTFEMDLLRLVEHLHDFTQEWPTAVMVKHLLNIVVAVNGEVSTTKLAKDRNVWRVAAAAQAAVWWLQNPNKSFEALQTSINGIA